MNRFTWIASIAAASSLAAGNALAANKNAEKIAAASSSSSAAPAAPTAPVAPLTPATPVTPSNPAAAMTTEPSIGLFPGDDAKPFATRHVMCDKIQLVWVSNANQVVAGPASVVVVDNKQGHTGVRFFVNRDHFEIVATQAWEDSAGGVRELTTLPGAPRIDYVDCQSDAANEGGIWIDYVDVKNALPY
jgi:hypothetical protein